MPKNHTSVNPGRERGRLAAERVHVEVARLVQVPDGDGEVEDRLHDRQAYGRSPRGAAPAAANRTQRAMVSGSWRMVGAPATARQGASAMPVAGSVDGPPGAIVHTQARRSKTGATPSAR